MKTFELVIPSSDCTYNVYSTYMVCILIEPKQTSEQNKKKRRKKSTNQVVRNLVECANVISVGWKSMCSIA